MIHRPRLVAALLAAGLLGFVGRGMAQSMCTAPSPWSSSLVLFCADTPARAADVNQNFSALLGFIQQKVGAVGSTNLTVTGASALQGGLTVTGGTTSITGVTTVTGATTVNGPLQATSLKTTLVSVVPTTNATLNATNFSPTDLTASFTVPAGGATVEFHYALGGDTTGPCFLVTRLMLAPSGSPFAEVTEARAIAGVTQYPSVEGHTLRSLSAGTYQVGVEYRTNGTLTVNPSALGFGYRKLQVHIFGNN